MVRQKVLDVVHDVWHGEERGILQVELLKALSEHGISEKTIDDLVKEGVLRTMVIADETVYVPHKDNRARKTETKLPVQEGEYEIDGGFRPWCLRTYQRAKDIVGNLYIC